MQRFWKIIQKFNRVYSKISRKSFPQFKRKLIFPVFLINLNIKLFNILYLTFNKNLY